MEGFGSARNTWMEAPSRPNVAHGFCFPGKACDRVPLRACHNPACLQWRGRPIQRWYRIKSPEFPTRVVLHGKSSEQPCTARCGRSHRVPRAGLG